MTKPAPKDDPGQVPPDPARRPGQPGAEPQPVDDTPTGEKPPGPGGVDERGVPVNGPIGDQPADGELGEPARDDAEVKEPPLSDGSVRAGPV